MKRDLDEAMTQSNAYAVASQLACVKRDKAEGMTVFIPVSLLQDLLAEIDRLQKSSIDTDKVRSIKP